MRKYKNIKEMAEILKIQESDFQYFLAGGYFENNYTQVQKSEEYPNGIMFREKHVENIMKIQLPTAPSKFRVKKELELKFTARSTRTGGMDIVFEDGENIKIESDIMRIVDQVEKAEKQKRKYTRKANNG